MILDFGLGSWPAIVFGWPAAALGAVLLAVGVLKLRAGVALAGVLVSAGFLTYMALNPMPLRAAGIGCLLANFACAVSVLFRRRRDAVLWLLPYLVFVGYVVGIVL